jgi:hypothetical protein
MLAERFACRYKSLPNQAAASESESAFGDVEYRNSALQPRYDILIVFRENNRP